MGKDYQEETSISSSTKIVEINSSLSSWASTGELTFPDITQTVSEDTNIYQPHHQLQQPHASQHGSHTFRFNRCSQRAGFEVGKCLASDTFTAEFELTLVDQSGRGKHRTQTHFGFLMRQRGSQWGFGRYMKKKYLEKLGYLKDDCMVVNCVVGILAFGTELEISASNLESAAKTIIEFESPSQLQGLLTDGDHGKFDQYLYAVDQIQLSIRSGISGYDTHRTCAIRKLQLVFQKILDCSVTGTNSDAMSTTVYSSSVTSSYNYELQGNNQTGHGELSREQVYRLHNIVERLNSTGCLGDCINMYRISRKTAVDARYLRFCIGKWTYNDLQRLDCEEFTAKITELPHMTTVSWLLLNMLQLIANISYGASNIVNSLATLVRKLFSSFQDTVLNDQINTLPPKGTVHSLTEYAMRYVTSISFHKELLTNIIVSPPTIRLGDQADKQFLEASSVTPLRLHMISIMISLRINLEGKSSLYKDSSLSYVFIMNNVNYMIKTITGSPELLQMIGKEYPLKLSKDVLQAAQNYTSSIWHRVLYCLRDDGLSFKFPLYNVISKNSVKNRFKTFNTTFEEVCQIQSTMSVLDIQLQGQIHKLIPAYNSFLEKFGSHLQSKRYKERYIKYSSQDLENKLKSLFSEH
ncbi:hypothetical protein POM88_033988 [Heracleum sosnowskyi]|uniref:Exocyst subunit Exo70 family protein n=1 Tax=Heracleum sosnowskyi TaxID=360622 RepID=A0AAD8HIP0_9APIA|nr:hypothetical protein POM88_033988 [Heracleum sosnowskyi]